MQTQQPPSFWQRNATFLKAIVVGFLILVLMIPNTFITELVRERQEKKSLQKWVPNGPVDRNWQVVLLLPYWKQVWMKEQTVNEKETAYFLPGTITRKWQLFPVRHHPAFLKAWCCINRIWKYPFVYSCRSWQHWDQSCIWVKPGFVSGYQITEY